MDNMEIQSHQTDSAKKRQRTAEEQGTQELTAAEKREANKARGLDGFRVFGSYLSYQADKSDPDVEQIFDPNVTMSSKKMAAYLKHTIRNIHGLTEELIEILKDQGSLVNEFRDQQSQSVSLRIKTEPQASQNTHDPHDGGAGSGGHPSRGPSTRKGT